jgi:NAD(P)H-flavin reductase
MNEHKIKFIERIERTTVSVSPEETHFIEFTKRMTGSAYCKRLEELAENELIRVKGPYGSFNCDDLDGNIAMIAGGIGITPIRSILKNQEKQKRDGCKITLIYGNLNRDDIAFRDELEGFNIPGFKLVHVLSDPSGVKNAYKGFVTAEIIAKEVSNYQNVTFMISGPPYMVEAMLKATTKLNIPSVQIRTDVFLGYD